jgi:heterodisulfide reductase subunit A
MLAAMIARVEAHPGIQVLKNSRLKTAVGSVGHFVSQIEVGAETRAVTYGAAVIATGAGETVPEEYLFGQDDRIMTHQGFDRYLAGHLADLQRAQSVVFIQCVGSREPQRPYCSRICCTHTVKNAIKLKKLNPEMRVFVLYRDMRTYGARELLYRQARELGVVFVRFSLADKPRVALRDGDLQVQVTDPVLGRPLALSADYLVLAAAIAPTVSQELVELYKCAVNEDGFLNEAHPKLRPVDMSVDGLFVAGLCNYPKPVDEAIAQANAAAARAGIILSQKEMQLDAIKSFVTEQCDGCALCLDVCPYRAIRLESYDDETGRTHQRIRTDPALCKGCGLCAATCPKGGVQVHGFTLEQLGSQVRAALEAAG